MASGKTGKITLASNNAVTFQNLLQTENSDRVDKSNNAVVGCTWCAGNKKTILEIAKFPFN